MANNDSDAYWAKKEHSNMSHSEAEGLFQHDAEMMGASDAHLLNSTVHNISWQGINVTVKDRETKKPKNIVDRVDGFVQAGEPSRLLV